MDKKFLITVESNPAYCGEGAGGVQFAHGKAVTESANLAQWFKSHDGYTVEEIKPDVPKRTAR